MRSREFDGIDYSNAVFETPQQAGTLDRPTRLGSGNVSKGLAITRRALLNFAPAGLLLLPPAAIAASLLQPPRASRIPRVPAAEPPQPYQAESPHYWKTIEIRPDGSAHFTNVSTIVEARLDSGEKILAHRVLGPKYEYTRYKIPGTEVVINLGEIKPQADKTPILGGEYLMPVDKDGKPILDTQGNRIRHKAAEAVIEQPQNPQNRG